MKQIDKTKGTFIFVILFSIALSFPSQIFANWGMEVGRANEGDSVALLTEQLAMKMAQNRINEAITRPLAAERQRQLLGKSPNDSALPSALLDQMYDWWMKDVMGPEQTILNNPATSCAEAELSMRTLLSMMRQRQLMGMAPTEGNLSPQDVALDNMLRDMQAAQLERCRDEALDECVATGRIKQIVQTAVSQARLSQLSGVNFSAEKWAKESLKQCAVYDLHFVSSTNLEQGFKIDTVLDGKIKLKFVEDGGPIFGMTLKGETEGGNNPFFTSIKCAGPGITVACSPNAPSGGFEAKILDMELKHREFYTTADDVSAERIAGEDKIVTEFRAGTLLLQVAISIPGAPPIPMPFPVGTPFYIAHSKDRVGQSQTVKFEKSERGVYPAVFDFIYADRGVENGMPVVDSTHFELIHQIPKETLEKLYPPRKADAPRKPLVKRPAANI